MALFECVTSMTAFNGLSLGKTFFLQYGNQYGPEMGISDFVSALYFLLEKAAASGALIPVAGHIRLLVIFAILNYHRSVMSILCRVMCIIITFLFAP